MNVTIWFFLPILLSLLIQGVPINWWDGRHFLHHAKPNVVSILAFTNH